MFFIVRVEFVYGREDKWLITVLLRFNLLALLISLVTAFECFIAVRVPQTVALNDDATFFVIDTILPPNFATYGPRNAPSAAPPIVAAEIKPIFSSPLIRASLQVERPRLLQQLHRQLHQ